MPQFELHEVAPAGTFTALPLDQLFLSDDNVATRDRDKIDDLVASIAAHGLQNNLVVKPDGADRYTVTSGGRRLRALQQLKASGRFNGLVPVQIHHGDALQLSLTENITRADMHPADEFRAFKAMVDTEGLTVGDIAARFGKSERYVEQRLKLANVSPKLLAEYEKGGGIQLGQLMALAITDDHAEQERVWKAAKASSWSDDREPERLRRTLASKELEVGRDPVATYLGVDDYEAGGGVARRDLFSDLVWLPDAKLARRLAKEKLDQELKQFDGEGWSWKEARLDFDYVAQNKFWKYGMVGKYDYVDTGRKTNWPAAAKTVAGIVATIDHKGNIEVRRGLVKPTQQAAAIAAFKGKAAPAAKQAAGKDTTSKPAKRPTGTELSFAQVQVLRAHRTSALRETLVANVTLAKAALAARLAIELGVFKTDAAIDRLVRVGKIHQSEGRLPVNVRDVVEKSPEQKAIEAEVQAWRKRVPKGSSILEYLLQQPEKETDALLALCAARALIAVDDNRTARDAGAQLARLAQLDMTAHWQPTAEWLEKQSTGFILAAVKDACGKLASAELAKVKGKKPLAKKAAELLATVPGTGKRWLPEPLRTPEAPAAKPAPAKKSTKQRA
jgi:ParB family chromosome partitioning protein